MKSSSIFSNLWI